MTKLTAYVVAVALSATATVAMAQLEPNPQSRQTAVPSAKAAVKAAPVGIAQNGIAVAPSTKNSPRGTRSGPALAVPAGTAMAPVPGVAPKGP